MLLICGDFNTNVEILERGLQLHPRGWHLIRQCSNNDITFIQNSWNHVITRNMNLNLDHMYAFSATPNSSWTLEKQVLPPSNCSDHHPILYHLQPKS